MKTLFVLAGGFGTRLRPVISNVQSHSLQLAVSLLFHLVRHWVSQGVDDFIFLLHYEADQIEKCLSLLNKQAEYKDIRFRFIKEEIPLGTGGLYIMHYSIFVQVMGSWLLMPILGLEVV